MSFLAPLFILGALAVAAPILFHLIRRTSKEKVPFSSLMFLQPTPPRVTKKSRLENILLLVLRCTILCLLALAFGRPFLRNPLSANSSGSVVTRTVVLLDTSASMRREGLWDEAQAKAVEAIRQAAPGDQVSVYAFDRNARASLTFEEWSNAPLNERKILAERRIRALKPTWNNTHVGNALLEAVEAIEAQRENPDSARRVVIISDMQEGARLEGLQGFDWPKPMQVSVVSVKSKKASNAGVQLLAQPVTGAAPQAGDTAAAAVRMRVNNSIDSRQEQFSLRWSGSASNPTAIYIPPGQSRSLDLPKSGSSDVIELTGDEHDFDNRVYAVTPPPEQIEVLFIGDDVETDPQQLLFYLKRAFPETAGQTITVKRIKPDADIASSSSARLIVVGAPLAENTVRDVSNLLTNGASVLSVLRTSAEVDVVRKLSGKPVTAEESSSSGYAMLAEIDFAHPLFAPFADARFSDFTKIHFWKSRRLDFGTTNAQVLAKLDTGSAAVAQLNVGKGSVFVFASGWQPRDSQLALSSKFVPLLYSLLELTGAIKNQALTFLVGDSVALSSFRATNALTVRKPDGSTVPLNSGARSFAQTDMPGIYSVTGEGSIFRFAVNLAPEESRTGPMAAEQLQQLGVPLQVQPVATAEQLARREAQLKGAELESHQKLWRWLIVATLVVLIVETWVAARLSRRAAVQLEGAS